MPCAALCLLRFVLCATACTHTTKQRRTQHHHRLWLNGGPGCSSFDGWVYEQGPFKLSLPRGDRKAPVKLSENPFAWSKAATVIFLDSPSREF